MKQTGTLVVSLILILIMLGVAVWLYPHLPAQVAIHWDMQGHVNGWAPRFWAVAVWPVVMLGIAVLATVLPAISPRKFEIEPFARTWHVLMLVIQAFLLVVGVCAMLAGAGYRVPIPLVGTLAVGALFMVLGNYMGKLRKNFFIGIRTPWTLASDAVWERTHRLGGWLFMATGVAWTIVGVSGASSGWLVGVVLAAALIPCVYSYFAYRRLDGRTQSGGRT